MPTVEGLTLAYALHDLPPGKFPFRRWRWELWHGERLLAAGWRTTPKAAERAVQAYASDFGHRMFGLRPPPRELIERRDPGFRPGTTVRMQVGAVAVQLVPRGLEVA